MNIEINYDSADGLSRERYEIFADLDFGNTNIHIQGYWAGDRKTKRHNWSASKKYSRIFTRDNTIKLEEIPIPADLKDRVKSKIIESLKFNF
jgi:hypothetical protein